MYELEDSKMASPFSGAESSYSSGIEDKSSNVPKILVLLLSAVLLFSFVVVLGVVIIGSQGNGAETGIGTSTPAAPVTVHIPTLPRRESVTATVTTAPHPRTVRTLSPTHPPGLQSCPAGGYHGKSIGMIRGYTHGLSGFVYAASDSSVIITSLSYDGTDSAAHFWAQYSTAHVNDMVGDELPDENGSNDALKAYKNATVQIKLPKVITAYQSLGIYSAPRNRYLGYVSIPKDYELPARQILGKPVSMLISVRASEIVLTDSSTMMLKGFVNHARCPLTYFVAAPTSTPSPEELTYLIYDGNKMGELESYNGTDMTINLPEGCHWNRFQWFSVFCVKALSSLCDIDIFESWSHQLPLHSSQPVLRP